ncbi:hypothetical protein FA132_28730, partial [Pseudomonas aeruginosa]|nr:hypothetical protein [Pseudomonas aeruginosa]
MIASWDLVPQCHLQVGRCGANLVPITGLNSIDARQPHLYICPICGFHAIRPPSPLSSGQAFQGHLAT